MSSQKLTGTLIAVLTAVSMVGLAFLIPSAPTVPSQPPKTVDYVDLEKYQGTWYDIADIPSYFSVGCTKGQATYTLNDDKKSVKVDNKCLRYGSWSESVGKATVKDEKTNAKLEVSFFPGTGGAYWIVRLPEDYSYVVVSDDKYKYLWVLSRETQMDEKQFNSIIEDLKKDGFPVEKLVMQKR